MKCWKCGQEIAEGAGTCPRCGAAQARPAPTSEMGRAMRALYDRYGAQEVLTNGAYLVNGLADLTDVDRKFRSQLRMALDAGLGKAYLEQLRAGGPDAAFDDRVKILLTEDAGLNGKTSAALAGYFDEMIGWRAHAGRQPQAGTGQQTPPRPQPQGRAEKHTPGWNEVDRTGRYTAPAPGTESRQAEKAAPLTLERRYFRRERDWPHEDISITLRSDTRQIQSLTYSATYQTYREATEKLVRDGLKDAGESLHAGKVMTLSAGSGIVGYEHELGFSNILQAEAQGFVRFARMSRDKKPEIFKLEFSRTADRFAEFLRKEGFKQTT